MKTTNNFNDLLRECKPGDLLFFKDDSLISRAIRRFDSDKKNVGWSHVEKIVDIADTPWVYYVIMLSARKINGGMVELGLLNTVKWRDGLQLFLRRPINATAEQIRASIAYSVAKRGTKYDYKSILGKALNLFGIKYKDNPRKYFCSEICRDADKITKIITHREKTTEPDPSELSTYPEYIDIMLFKKNKNNKRLLREKF